MEKKYLSDFFNENEINRGNSIELIDSKNEQLKGIFHGVTLENILKENKELEEVLFIHLELENNKFKSLPYSGVKKIVVY